MWPSELNRGYNGYVLRREGKAILFGGDTAETPLFTALRSRGPFEAAIMPIGAYRPWIWNHCTPEQAVRMANRSEEHTSELQSQSNLVCRLLLEKKKTD